MKIVGITMVTNPDYRQDPWRESIAQMLMLVDQVVVVCGRSEDVAQVKDHFVLVDEMVEAFYLHWPQPDWSYDELPYHLNAGLAVARKYDPDWIVKFDIDNLIHEDDHATLKAQLTQAAAQNKALASVEKYQFHHALRCYEKGKMPIFINAKHSKQVVYGRASETYTDLCQPIIVEGNIGTTRVPMGPLVPESLIFKTSAHVWNYDYTFKTEDRSRELLYFFDRSHAKFWGEGYGHKSLDDITPESAFDDFIKAVTGHMSKSTKLFMPQKHPKKIQRKLESISNDPQYFGYGLWGKVKL